MSDALPLPPRPNLEQYKKLAKDFQHACKSGITGAVAGIAAHWLETLYRLRGTEITSDLKHRFAEESGGVEHHWNELQKKRGRAGRCLLADVQLFIARGHGFASWPKFAKHLNGLARSHSSVATFETAADAIVSGDITLLEQLLRENPDLVHARSTREHRSTLLHYVSANGIEDFRQKTPKNIVKAAKMLLDASADVNAESDAYGGRSTTLGLTATSCHPDEAGVQIPLLELLLQHGAIIDGPDRGSTVNGCLHNGRRQAAEFFANRGARLDLEAAAGIGRLDLVMSFFDSDGSLKSTATQKQLFSGFAFACGDGREDMVDFFLQHGVQAGTKLDGGATGLHWASYRGHPAMVKLLLERGAPVDPIDEMHDGTPLEWALYAWGSSEQPQPYYEVAARLVQAGAKLRSEWYEDNGNRQRALARMRSDPQMQAAFRGEMPD